MAKKRPNIIGKDVIGIDEINNGYHLNHHYGSLNPEHRNLPLITVGYLIREYEGSQQANEQYEAKGGVFVEKGGRKLEDIQKRALGYIHRHQDFFYSRIKSKEASSISPMGRRAESVASIVLRFFNDYNLSENDTFICLDNLGFNDATESLRCYLKELFNASDLFRESFNTHVYFQKHADKFNRACKFADRTAYHLMALKFRTPKTKWPFRDRITDPSSFPDYMINRLYNPNK